MSGSNFNKTMLLVLDGYGLKEPGANNAISQANTPDMNRLFANNPHSILKASGEAVGLPAGYMGNSDVGHLTIGVGRQHFQDFARILKDIDTGDFYKNPVFLEAFNKAKEHQSATHLFILLSDAGVHSHLDHLYAMLKLCKMQGLKEVYVHAIMDGRDTPPNSGVEYMKLLQKKLAEIGVGKVATIQGRYFIKDRDNKWDRIEKGYNVLTAGIGVQAEDPVAAIKQAYADQQKIKNETGSEQKVSDEFIDPIVLTADGKLFGLIKDGDVVINLDFRADRAIPLSYCLTQDDKEFKANKNGGFERRVKPAVHYVCMTRYANNIKTPVAFEPIAISNTLGEIISNNGLKQLRIAETEKFKHVTKFFDGGKDMELKGAERALIPSPKVATYDLQPEMSAFEVLDTWKEKIQSGKFDFIVMNLANPDMVGHTGILSAAVKAVEVVDKCVGDIVELTQKLGWKLLIIADHGNSEEMVDHNQEPHTAHTQNDVPCIYVGADADQVTLKNGGLSDIAPTILDMIGLAKPAEMTGESLIIRG
ncbi:MAG: 2,3-bisphosphoglycerate-independent phosphoglycerate mutase [Candidatus Margulisiibacteriota bacterium]